MNIKNFIFYEHLSKDINSIIEKYLDFSVENIKRIINKNKFIQNKTTFKNISVIDIILLCSFKGHSGFYFDKEFYDFKNQIEKEIINKKLDINITLSDKNYYVYIKNDKINVCHYMTFRDQLLNFVKE